MIDKQLAEQVDKLIGKNAKYNKFEKCGTDTLEKRNQIMYNIFKKILINSVNLVSETFVVGQ